MKTLLVTIAIIWSLLSVVPVRAETNFGWALLAMQHKDFPCRPVDIYIKAAPHPYVSVLYGSFGTKTKCLKRFTSMSSKKKHTIQFYMSNEVGRRKNNLASYEFLPNLSVGEYNKKLERNNRRVVKKVKRQSKAIKKLCSSISNTNTRCLIAIGLESQFSKGATKRLVNILKEEWNVENIIHNPVEQAPHHGRSGANYYESHGLFAVPRGPASKNIVSLDGATPDLCPGGGIIIGDRVSDAAMRGWAARYRRTTAYAGNWCPMHQGLRLDSGVLGHPRQRLPRVTNREFVKWNSIIENSTPKKENPNAKFHTVGCGKVEKWGSGSLIKESDHGGVVALFSPSYRHFSRVEIVSPTGKKFSLKYTGMANPFNGKDRQHWRDSNKPYYTFKNKSVVKAKSGSHTFCWKVPVAGKRYG